VRFLLERPAPDLAARLASPQLGIVSPLALEREGGERSRFRAGARGSGTGPFELGASAAGRLELSRYAGWWGSPLGLGPALDGVAFVEAPTAAERLGLLTGGEAQVADPLDAAGLAATAGDPLLDAVGGPVAGIGLEASVRGIESARAIPLLSRVWLTDVSG
jgi:ABC-type transport system substrate-binding protein